MTTQRNAAGLLLCGVALAALSATGPALAQTTAGGPQLDEVVVTAQRTETSLQRTPIAVTAFNNVALQQRGVVNLMDLSVFAPNVSINGRAGAGTARASFSIRGMGVNAEDSAAAVGVYVDEVFFASSWGNALGLLDTQRVEILRGPQGTLFGRNTIAGAVQYVSVKPSQDFGGYIQATGGNLKRRGVEGAVNVPFNDELAMRAAISNDRRGGHVTDDFNNIKRGASETTLMRLQFRWTPSSRLTVDLKAERGELRNNGRPVAIVGVNPLAQLALGAGATTFRPPPAPPGSFTTVLTPAVLSTRKYHHIGYNAQDHFRAEQDSFTGTISYDLTDTVKIKSISAYTVNESSITNDLDLTPFPIFAGSRGLYRDWTYSQELQLTGTALADRLNWTAGVYYFNTKGKKTGQAGLIGLAFRNAQSDSLNRGEAEAAYVQATYKITEPLSVTAGVRFSHEKLTATNLGGATFPNPTLRYPYTHEVSYNDTSPYFGVNYQAAESAMLYAKASKGFRAGGFTINDNLPTGAAAFTPETAWTYEAGARLEFMNRRLRLNPTVFYTSWKNIQFNQLLFFPIVGPTISTRNAGDAELKGAELEGQWAATDRLLLTATASYLDSHYTRVGLLQGQVFPYGPTDVVTTLFVTDPLQQAPKWKYSLGARYTQPLAGGAELVGSLDWGWTDDFRSAVTRSDALTIQSYGLLSGRLTFRPAGGRWSLSVWGTNLTNKYHLIGGTGFAQAGTVGVDEADVGRPREYGLTLRADF